MAAVWSVGEDGIEFSILNFSVASSGFVPANGSLF